MVYLTEDSFDWTAGLSLDERSINLEEVGFIDPFGMVGLLEMGEILKNQGIKKKLYLPRSEEVLKYLERMDFLSLARQYFTLEPENLCLSEKYLRSGASDVLLEITPIKKAGDIHTIVGKVKERAHTVLTRHLNYEERAVDGFIVALAEVCQNVVDHSENKGFVGIQKYRFHSLGKNVVKIAVMDIGVGFRRSLGCRFPFVNDLEAIEKALVYGVSRHSDEGRGQGLKAVKRFTSEWNGKLSIRSGTARVSMVPHWAWGRAKEDHLVPFPGAQISIILPEKDIP